MVYIYIYLQNIMGLGSFNNTYEIVKLVSLRLLCTFFNLCSHVAHIQTNS